MSSPNTKWVLRAAFKSNLAMPLHRLPNHPHPCLVLTTAGRSETQDSLMDLPCLQHAAPAWQATSTHCSTLPTLLKDLTRTSRQWPMTASGNDWNKLYIYIKENTHIKFQYPRYHY